MIDSTSSQLLLAHADALLVIADFLRPPQRANVPAADDAVKLAEAAFPDDEACAESFTMLCECLAQTPADDWSDDYHRLFEGPLICPINETAYIRRDKGAILADLCGFYRAFSFENARGSGEKADHLRCELEFFAVLLIMAAQALAQSRESEYQTTMDAIRAFATDHLCEWLAPFSGRLVHTTRLEAYQRLAEFLLEDWRILSRTLDLPEAADAPFDVEATGALETDEGPMECGAAEATSTPRCELTIQGETVAP